MINVAYNKLRLETFELYKKFIIYIKVLSRSLENIHFICINFTGKYSNRRVI